MLVSTLATSCTYHLFLVLVGHNLVFDLAITSLVLNVSSVPLFGAEFVERVSGDAMVLHGESLGHPALEEQLPPSPFLWQ